MLYHRCRPLASSASTMIIGSTVEVRGEYVSTIGGRVQLGGRCYAHCPQGHAVRLLLDVGLQAAHLLLHIEFAPAGNRERQARLSLPVRGKPANQHKTRCCIHQVCGSVSPTNMSTNDHVQFIFTEFLPMNDHTKVHVPVSMVPKDHVTKMSINHHVRFLFTLILSMDDHIKVNFPL